MVTKEQWLYWKMHGNWITATQRHANIRENKGPSLGKIQVKVPHQRSPYALKFEDRSQEETERQERCARGDAWRLAINTWKLKEKDKATFCSLTNEWCLPAPSAIKPEERGFVVDCRASMHMLSRKDLNSAELDTVRVSQSPTTVVTANGEVQTREEATVCVKELDLSVTVKLLEDTPAVLSLGKLCEDHGYSYEWTSGQKPHLIKGGRRIKCSTEKHAPIVVSGLPTGSSSSGTLISPTSVPQEAEIPTLHPASTRSESPSSTVREHPSHESAETKNTNKSGDNETVRGHSLRDLPEWLEEFTENLVDERVPVHKDAPASSSHGSAP